MRFTQSWQPASGSSTGAACSGGCKTAASRSTGFSGLGEREVESRERETREVNAGEVEEEREEEGVEVERPKVSRSPKDPTREEIEEHLATGHAVHRSWCGHCVRARTTLHRHGSTRDEEEEEGSLPTVAIDYFWYSEDKKDTANLQVKDSKSKHVWASAVPQKGADDYAVNFLINCLKETGYQRLVLKSDNENSIKALKEQVKDNVRGIEVILKESPTGDKQANGLAEVAVRETKRQSRALVSELEERLGKIPPKNPLLLWLSRHATFCLSRFKIGDDGRTPYTRLTGRKWKRPMVQFGERVWFRPLEAYRKGGDLETKVMEGLYVGTHGRNADVLCMTETGVYKGTSVKRMPEGQRWNKEGLDKLLGAPWKLRPNLKEKEDVDTTVVVELPATTEKLNPVPRDSGPRNLYVRRKGLKNEDGSDDFTPGCPGCHAVMLGLPAVTHDPHCRERIRKKLADTEEGKLRLEDERKRKSETDKGEKGSKEPKVSGEPDIEDMEVSAETATGGEKRKASKPTTATSQESKKQKEQQKGKMKRQSSTTVDDLYHEEEDSASPLVVSAEGAPNEHFGGGSGSAAPGSDLSHSQFWSPVVPGGASTATQGAEAQEQQTNLLLNSVTDAYEISNLQMSPEHFALAKDLSAIGLKREDAEANKNKEGNANFFGLPSGYVLELGQSKSTGEPWRLEKDLLTLQATIAREGTYLVIGNNSSTLDAAVELYSFQSQRGKYFLHEQVEHKPQERSAKAKAFLEGKVYEVQAECKAHEEEGYRRKKVSWITNSSEIAHKLQSLKTIERRPKKIHSVAQVHAIVGGLKSQMVSDGETNEHLIAVGAGPTPHEAEDNREEYYEGWFPKEENQEVVYESVTGVQLELEKVLKARREELDWIHKAEVYCKVPLEMCHEETGREPISLKWVDRNKGDQIKENFRSRLVVREIKKQHGALPVHESTSSMPPLEAAKLLCSLAVSRKVSKRGKPLKLALYDISRAHFYGVAKRRIFVTLPPGDEEEGKCALLLKSMYGTMDASHVWQGDYSQLLSENDFQAGRAWPAVFRNSKEDLTLLVHGDDFFVLSDDEGQSFMQEVLKKRYEFRIDGYMGMEESDDSHITVLNRLITLDKRTGAISFEADPRHAEMIIRQLGLESARAVATPNEKKKLADVLASNGLPPVSKERATFYRSLVMRAQFLAQDRADLNEAVKCLTRHMQNPTEQDLSDLKRLGRYLKSRPRVTTWFEPQKTPQKLTVFCDSDHAGCLLTRRSTTGLAVMFGRHCVKHSSNIQSTVALSSGESEYYAATKACALGMSIQALLEDWGYSVDLEVRTDSTAAIGTASRKGLGKQRHVQTRFLWLQEKVSDKKVLLSKVHTHSNIADLMTKPMSKESCEKLMSLMIQRFVEGRAVGAKHLVE